MVKENIYCTFEQIPSAFKISLVSHYAYIVLSAILIHAAYGYGLWIIGCTNLWLVPAASCHCVSASG